VSTAGEDQSDISIVIIDRQDVVHAGLEAWLTGSQPPIKIVGDYSDPSDFICRYPEASPGLDVVLFALQYEGHGPQFSALRQLCAGGHRVVVYSHLSTDEVILTSLDAGAVAYVAKSESGDYLRAAIHAARSDTPYVPPRMAKALLNGKRAGRPHLTEREKEVLVAWFQTENKECVGKRLFIEPSTVRTHLQRVRAKYAAVGRPALTKAALVARAIQDGYLSIDDL
jgi:DNA-binding NarL/FixJ family response regulator